MRVHPTVCLGLSLFLLQPPLASASVSPEEGAVQPSVAPVIGDDLFPAATGALEVVLDDGGEGPSFLELTRTYGVLTGQHVTFSEETKVLLEASKVQLDRSLEVPAADVQRIFEVMLRQSSFSLAVESAASPRVLRVRSRESIERSDIKQTSRLITADQLELARRHPALQFHVVVALPHSDVRQLSNSLRTMIKDPVTTMLLPAGNSSSMVVGGFGDWVFEQAKMLQAMDAAAASAQVERGEIIIALSTGRAEAIAETLKGAFSDSSTRRNHQVFIRASEETNSLLVSAPNSRMEAIRRVINALDR